MEGKEGGSGERVGGGGGVYLGSRVDMAAV